MSRQDLQAARERRLLLEASQRRAKACIRDAGAQAQAIRAQAFHDGYVDGLLQATQMVGRQLVEARTLSRQMHERVKRDVQDLLGELLMDRRAFETLMCRWYEQQGNRHGVLQVYLPASCKSHHARFKKALESVGADGAVIHYHAAQRFMFRLDDQVVELDVPVTRERLATQVLAQLDELPAAVRELDERACQGLAQLFDELLGNETAPVSAVPVDDEPKDETHAD